MIQNPCANLFDLQAAQIFIQMFPSSSVQYVFVVTTVCLRLKCTEIAHTFPFLLRSFRQSNPNMKSENSARLLCVICIFALFFRQQFASRVFWPQHFYGYICVSLSLFSISVSAFPSAFQVRRGILNQEEGIKKSELGAEAAGRKRWKKCGNSLANGYKFLILKPKTAVEAKERKKRQAQSQAADGVARSK